MRQAVRLEDQVPSTRPKPHLTFLIIPTQMSVSGADSSERLALGTEGIRVTGYQWGQSRQRSPLAYSSSCYRHLSELYLYFCVLLRGKMMMYVTE